MITPRLFRKAVARPLQWRLFLIWWTSLLVPGAIAAMPVFHFLGKQLDRSPLGPRSVASLDGAVFLDLMKQLGENGSQDQIVHGLIAAALTLLFLSPYVAGATVAAARSDEPLPLQKLLAGAGEYYGRMLRTLLAGLIPLAAGGGLAALAFRMADKANQRVTTETAADRNLWLAGAAAAAVVFVAHLLVDAARAQFAAEPGRRSALLALLAATRMVIRRPLRSLGLGALASIIGPGLAFAVMAARLQIHQATAGAIALAWVLAQIAQLCIAWGRNLRIFGFAELSRADTAERDRRSAFSMAEPATSPPPLVESSTLATLDPPRSGAVR